MKPFQKKFYKKTLLIDENPKNLDVKTKNPAAMVRRQD